VTYLLLLPQREKTDTGHLHDLEADTGNITLCLAAATETGDEDFVVFVDKVEATIVLQFAPLVQNPLRTIREKNIRTGTKAVTFLPFLMSWTRTHLRMAEFGCLASTPTFSRTIPFAWDEPPVGEVL
jgi:hypothetical protein